MSGGGEAVHGIVRAKEMGLHVVVSDGNPNAPGFNIADDRLVASTYDVDATVAAAAEYNGKTRRIDGAMCVAADVPLTVAAVASALGLPGIPLPSARLATDKLAMKERFLADGVPIPWFSAVDSAPHLRELVAQHGYPLVSKPVDSRGARGVLRLTSDVDLDWAYAESHRHSPTGRVMVERFLPGPQISTESLVLDGVAHTPGFSDRNYEFLERYAPYIIENGGDFPSRLPHQERRAVRDVVQEAARSMGIRNGIVKGDVVVSDGRAYVIEVAARLSGGYFCTHTIPLNTGVDFVGNAIRLALGDPIDAASLQPQRDQPVAQRYFFPRPGLVTSIDMPEHLRMERGIAYLEMRVKVGDIVSRIDNHPARAGVVITVGPSREDAIALAESVVRDVRIETRAT